jgi:hypothetical protein
VNSRNFAQLKWLLLDEAQAPQDIGTAWGAARDLFDEQSDVDLDDMVVSALLELTDEGLVTFYHSDLEKGYEPDFNREDLDVLRRDQVEVALHRIADEEDDASQGFLFFIATSKGRSVFRSRKPRPEPD